MAEIARVLALAERPSARGERFPFLQHRLRQPRCEEHWHQRRVCSVQNFSCDLTSVHEVVALAYHRGREAQDVAGGDSDMDMDHLGDSQIPTVYTCSPGGH